MCLPRSGRGSAPIQVVRVHPEMPTNARTAAYLARTANGAGVVIDDAGLVVTIGYLITEA